MHLKIMVSGENRDYIPFSGNTGSDSIPRRLAAFQAHLNRTGKVCPRPWCWRRFYNLFKPGYEPPWLTSWWATSTRDKKDLFLKQMEYLAWQTNHFHEAYQFLMKIDEKHWLFNK